MEKQTKIIRLGGLYDGDKVHQIYSVFDSKGICNTLDSAGGGGRIPYIIEVDDEETD